MTKWLGVFQSWVQAKQLFLDISATMWIKKGPAVMPTTIQSAGVTPEVNLRNTLHTGNETQGRNHQRPKQEYQKRSESKKQSKQGIDFNDGYF